MIGQSPSFSVSEFVAVFNQSLEMVYPQVIITGEISNFRVSKGKWVYFDLKDETASVKFFGTVFSLPGPLEDGIVCEVYGRPRLHQQFGFSIQIDSIRPVGEGSLKKAQNLLLRKLEVEGLFAADRKRPLPYPPGRVGLITSSESAAFADFNKIITARWPSLEIDLISTLVQGAQAPAEIVKAVQDFNMQSNPPEVVVIVRGGGSADDLAAFSEESVVRAVSASRIPTLVAIGHESDTSLAELAADKRASTPSNAAELLVPDSAHELKILLSSKKQLDDFIKNVVKKDQMALVEKLNSLNLLAKATLDRSKTDLLSKNLLLRALNPLMPLQQGYALVRSASGKHIKRAAQMKGSNMFSLEFTDGKKQIKLLKENNKLVQKGDN